jgi:hypothetical protein
VIAHALVALAFVAGLATAARAQQAPVPPSLEKTTLGDLLDRGGKRLSQAEMKQLISGATISGRQGGRFPDVTYTNIHSADGAVDGNAFRSKTWFTKIKGTWSIDASGQLCVDLLNDRQEKVAGCQPFYVVGANYYGVLGDARTAEANWRTLSH